MHLVYTLQIDDKVIKDLKKIDKTWQKRILSKIKTTNILKELADTKPMSVSLKDKIESLKKTLDKLNVKNASKS